MGQVSRTYTPKEQAIIDGWGMYWSDLSEYEQGFALKNNGFIENINGEKRFEILSPNGRYAWFFKGNHPNTSIQVSITTIFDKPCIRPVTLIALETNNGWYRVDEKTPSHGESITCFEDGEVYRDCVYYKNVDRFLDNQSETINPTHWRYDPMPPDPIY